MIFHFFTIFKLATFSQNIYRVIVTKRKYPYICIYKKVLRQIGKSRPLLINIRFRWNSTDIDCDCLVILSRNTWYRHLLLTPSTKVCSITPCYVIPSKKLSSTKFESFSQRTIYIPFTRNWTLMLTINICHVHNRALPGGQSKINK